MKMYAQTDSEPTVTSPSEYFTQYNSYKSQNPSLSEEQLQTEFSNVWTMYQNSKNIEQTQFAVNKFLQESYGNSFDTTSIRKYAKVDIDKFLENPSAYGSPLREVAIKLYNTSQEFKNLARYFSKMLTFDYILTSDSVNPETYKNKKFMSSFYENLQFVEDYNLKYKLGLATDILVKEDFYYAYERTNGVNYLWQQLPSNFCRCSGKDVYETYTFEFDFSFFSNKNINLDNYDIEFMEGYQKFKGNKDYRWQKLNSMKAICFKFDESVVYGLPNFAGIFDELFKLEDIKEQQTLNDKLNNYKLIHQEMPMEKDKKNGYIIDAPDAIKYHNNTKNNLPTGIAVSTNPFKTTAISLKNNNSAEENLVSKETENILRSSGVSGLIFSSTASSSAGLDRSIENDEAVMFSLLRQYFVWTKKRMKLFNDGSNGNRKLKWKLNFPEITRYNRDEMFEKLLKSAQFGYAREMVAASLGYSQADMLSLMELESLLDLESKMIPLQSSHTSDGTDDGGRPSKSAKKLGDAGTKTKDLDSNKNRN